jgi:hypothetical protein
MRKGFIVAAAITFGLGGVAGSVVAIGGSARDPAVERGRYLAQIGGCNGCHTPGYTARNGQVAEARWLVGDSLGYNGPWGTTYPANLRSYLSTMDMDAWVEQARTLETRPPMPWFNLRAFFRSGPARHLQIYRFTAGRRHVRSGVRAAGPGTEDRARYRRRPVLSWRPNRASGEAFRLVPSRRRRASLSSSLRGGMERWSEVVFPANVAHGFRAIGEKPLVTYGVHASPKRIVEIRG